MLFIFKNPLFLSTGVVLLGSLSNHDGNTKGTSLEKLTSLLYEIVQSLYEFYLVNIKLIATKFFSAPCNRGWSNK